MKSIRLTTLGVLLTSIFSVGTTLVSADEVIHEAITDVEIEFVPGGDISVVDPKPTPKPIDPIEPIDPDAGPLAITTVPNFNFGNNEIGDLAREYNMVAEMRQLEGTEGEENQIPYVSFAQVRDVRGSNQGWDLQVSLGNFTAETQNSELRGAQIELVQGHLHYLGQQENRPAVHQNRATLMPGGAGVSVLTAGEGQGAGISSVVWGDQEQLMAQHNDPEIEVVENDTVKLTIPNSTAIDAATYKSTLTWELSSTPGDDA